MIPSAAESLDIYFSEFFDTFGAVGVHLRWCITAMESVQDKRPTISHPAVSNPETPQNPPQNLPPKSSGVTDPQRARQIFQSAIRYAQGNSRPALAIAPDCRGGIIIKKGHYSDFIGPGAAVVNRHDLQGNKVVPVGRLKFVPLKTPEERQHALSQRVAYLRTLEEIARSPVALRRSCQIVEYLCDWLSEADARTISDELVGSLVGVVPLAIQMAWRTQNTAEQTNELPSHGNVQGHSGSSVDESAPEELGTLEYQDARQRAAMQSRLPSLR